MPIRILRQDRIELDGTLELKLELNINACGRGFVRYEHGHSPIYPKETLSKIYFVSKSWSCRISPRNWNIFTNTVPEAVRKGNLFYDRMLSKYTGQEMNLPDLEEMMNGIQSACDDYQKKLKGELKEPSEQRALNA